MGVRFSPSTSPGGNALGSLAGRAIGAGLIEHKRQADEMKKAALLLELQTKRLEQDREEFEQQKAQHAAEFDLNIAKAGEAQRSNLASEARLGATAAETVRHNRESEANSVARTKAMGSASVEKVKAATDELADAKNHAHGVLSQMAQGDPNMGKDADAIFRSVMEQKTAKGVTDKLNDMLGVYRESVSKKHGGELAGRISNQLATAQAGGAIDETTSTKLQELAQSLQDGTIDPAQGEKLYQDTLGAHAKLQTDAQTNQLAAQELEQVVAQNPDPQSRTKGLHTVNMVKVGAITPDQGRRQIEDQGIEDMAFKRAMGFYRNDLQAWSEASGSYTSAPNAGPRPQFEMYLDREKQRLGLGQGDQGQQAQQAPAAPADPIQEAAKMKAQGATKEQVRAFLAQHGIKLKD